MTDDTLLLQRYATERAEDAFAELVRRNLPFVYSAALRRLNGDAHRAQDVAQTVFCALARDARRVARHPVLAGWLYTATKNAVIDIVRAEKRRRVREEEAHNMQQIMPEPESSADWSRLKPVLDSAMDQLSARDREAVLLRFFQGRAFAEIGGALGLSEEAARKRVDRALDTLGGLLRRRGIASTSVAVAALLGSEAIASTPAGLTASVTGAALATGSAAGAGLGTFVALTKLQAGIAAVVVAGGAVGLIQQQQTISELRLHQAALEQHVAQVERENNALQGKVVTGVIPDPKPGEALAKLQDAPAPEWITTPNPYVTPRAPSPMAKLLPLPNTPEIARKKQELHRRYDPFFRSRSLTPEQGERFVELMVHQGIVREELQASVRATGMDGGSAAVEKLRGQLNEPITQEITAMLGSDGYRAYGEYEKDSYYRQVFAAKLLSELSGAGAPLSDDQAKRLVRAIAANDRRQRIQATDIATRSRIDWNAVAKQTRSAFTPAQQAIVEAYAAAQPAAQLSP